MRLRRLFLLLALVWLPPAGEAAAARIVAVGDIHGEIDGFDSVLRAAELMDGEGNWVGGGAVLVQTGDVTDRGARVRAVMDRLRSLAEQAPAGGGRVVPLLGNHEISNLILLFDEQSTPAAVYRQIWADFADQDAAKRQRAAYRQWRGWNRRYPGCVKPENQAWRNSRDAWLQDHPPGFVEYVEALSPAGEYGRWLRGLDVAVAIDGTVFLHGGLGPQLVAEGYDSLAAINRAVGQALEQHDQDRARLVADDVILPFSSLWEMHCAVFVELARLEKSGSSRDLARRAELTELDTRLPGKAGWFPTEEHGPLWYRGLAMAGEAELAPDLAGVLAAFGAERMVVGHTPQPGKIRPRFDGQVYLIDTAMAYPELGGGAAALELDGARITAIYPGKRVPLAPAPPPAPDSPAPEPPAPDPPAPDPPAPDPPAPDPAATDPPAADPPAAAPGVAPPSPAGGNAGASGAPLEATNGHATAPLEASNGHDSEPLAGGAGDRDPAAEPPADPSAAEPGVAAAAEPAPPEPVWLGPEGEPLPFTGFEAALDFLAQARVKRDHGIDTGITRPRKLVLERDGVRAHAIFHDVAIEKRRERLHGGMTVNFFRDHYANNVAAFELSRLLGMSNVPPAVIRRVGRDRGSVQLWIENTITEEERRRRRLVPPGSWQLAARDMQVFDNLLNNIDRNQGNILYDDDGSLWLIDHTRAFGRVKQLPSPERVKRCSRRLWRALRALDPAAVESRLRPYVGIYEIGGLMARRDLLVALIEERIAELSEAAVLFDYGDPASAAEEDGLEVPAAAAPPV